MAKTQRSLFETGKDNRRPEAGGLLLVSRPDRPLTAAQREFNKLLIKVEELRERLRVSKAPLAALGADAALTRAARSLSSANTGAPGFGAQ